MAIKKFEDILVWQRAQALAVEIYENFGSLRDYGFREQITRASVSISNNIAEGFERSSNSDFVRFLYFASASNSEVRSMLYLSVKLNFISKEKASDLIDKTNEISKVLFGFIKSISKKE
ncbi:four helix bundle protein [Cellulophaga sp. Hel_I_12]|uniref:four helix bundle protein n=1 Tax=Cellulophaga sp. Hel_I_12 TaxID=1249972 RepID=UPI000647A4B0|nr:four helix bundle protein [Cellulophaga sp. Hel_I_12]